MISEKIHGVCTVLAPHVILEEVFFSGPRLLLTLLIVKQMRLAVINAYAPTDLAPPAQKDQFYADLRTLRKKIPPKYKEIIAGDFNAIVVLRNAVYVMHLHFTWESQRRKGTRM